MDTKNWGTRRFAWVLAKTLSIFVILSLLFVGSASAQEPAPTPTPWLIAFPENEAVEAWEWPEGSRVTLTIDNAPEGFFKEGTAEVTTWGDPRTYVRFEFWEEYDLQVGDMVTLTDEFNTSTTHQVQPLSITAVDVDLDTVAGMADVGAQLQVWIHGQDDLTIDVDVAGDGSWLAQLEGDITFGTGGRSWVVMEGGNATAVDWNAPNTRFTVWPEWNYLEGYEWPDEAVVSIKVAGKGICSTLAVSGFPEGDPSNTFFSVNFPEGCELAVGDFITLSYETISLSHQIQDLAITEVDLEFDTVAGTALFDPEQYLLHTWIHGIDGSYMHLSADGGTWLADYKAADLDLVEGMGGRVELVDQNSNATTVEWYIPNPHFTVFPEWEWYDGYEWPDGVPVTITIDGKEECNTEGESSGGFFNGGFPEGCDVAVGDIVRFDDGETFRWHEVQNLSISKVNQEDDIVKGIANPGSEVYVWPHATGQEQLVIANPKGKWNVDFFGIYDLMTGDAGRAEVRDEVGNATAVDWYVSQPRFTIFPDAQWFDGIDWPDGSIVTISVKNKPECTFERESWSGFFNGGFPEGCIVTAGDRVTFTDGKIIRKHRVQNLAILIVDEEENTVSGIADSGKVVHLWVWNSSDGSFVDGSDLEVTAVDGAWLVDYDDVGLDLQIGMGIQAEIRDENGNTTSVDLLVPDPRIVASLSDNWVYCVDFIPGSTLTLTISQSNGAAWEVTTTTDVNGFAWIYSEGWELDPGDLLIAKDVKTTKELEVEDAFTFDVFDLTNGHLEGTAPESIGSTVWAGFGYEDGGWSQYVTIDETGAWQADYGGPIPPDYWWVWAQIFDEDGDATELRPASIIISCLKIISSLV